MAHSENMLTVSPFEVVNPDAGGKRRILGLNSGYARAGWIVHQIWPGSFKDIIGSYTATNSTQIADGYTCEVINNLLLSTLRYALMRAGGPLVGPSLLPRWLLPSNKVRSLVAKSDVIMFEHPHSFDLVSRLLSSNHFVVLDAHNIDHKLCADQASHWGLAGISARKLRTVEARAFARADLVLSCSREDMAEAVIEFGVTPEKMMFVPNGADISNISPASLAERNAAKALLGVDDALCLFVGSLWTPNVDAALAILRMAANAPDLTFAIVGDVGRAISHSLPANVIVAGRVDDLQIWYHAADIAINPVTSGGGSNVKNFEYLAAGLPIVSTEFGAREIDAPFGTSVAIADLDNFPRTIRALLNDPALDAHRRKARMLAEERYDWESISRGVSEEIHRRLALRRSR